ncbi:MAG: NAD-binding protein [Cyanobacteria bacterium J06636_16]
MYLIIVGAEPEGLHLIDFAVRDGYEITLIEPDQEKARKVLKHHDIQVLNSGIDEESILDEANADRADAIAAITLDDAVNLMAVMLGREYGIENRVAIVRQTQHEKLFERTGAKVLSNPAEVVAKQLHQMIDAQND